MEGWVDTIEGTRVASLCASISMKVEMLIFLAPLKGGMTCRQHQMQEHIHTTDCELDLIGDGIIIYMYGKASAFMG